jgi:hypothetical protein
VCRGRSKSCNPLAPRIDKNLGNPVVKKVWVRTLADRRGIRLLSVNTERPMEPVKLLVNWAFSWSHSSIEFFSSDLSQVSGA